MCAGATRNPGSTQDQQSFIRGLRPEVQPLTLLYTIFDRNPFVYPLLTNYPFSHTLFRSAPFLNMKKENKTYCFLDFFRRHKLNLVALLGFFTDRNDRFFYPFIYFNK